jgi:hypothetical protein
VKTFKVREMGINYCYMIETVIEVNSSNGNGINEKKNEHRDKQLQMCT